MDNLARELSINEWLEAEDRASCDRAAARLGVSPEVHDDDFIFKFCHDHPSFPDKDTAISHYFEQGAESGKKVRNAVDRWMGRRDRPLSILEFASGYGSVTRHAKKELAPHRLTSCDIHEEAVEFLAARLGVQTTLSRTAPEALEFPERYDVIFALSFFSHIPRKTWFRWLSRLHQGLATGGMLLFTTHGRMSLPLSPNALLEEDGFWFKAVSEQRDLDASDYGTTITLKKFVDSRIALLQGAEYLYYELAGWWGHQDVYVLRKGE
jgi:SAM-dependent methyltransferase